MAFTLGTQASAPGLKLIQAFEGFHTQAYADPLHGWRLATIGFGTTVYSHGQPVQQGDTITRAEAQQELEYFIVKKIHPALMRIPYIQDMNETMIGALECFAYNLGAEFYGGAHFQSITRCLKYKDWQHLRSALILYINPGSVVEAGLRRRRQAEADLWEQGLKELDHK